jgi:hypothetical protein
MNKKELSKVDKAIESLNVLAALALKKRGFYAYYNIPNKSSRTVVIHKHNCGQCAFGTGKIINSISGKNGVWIGPFLKKPNARSFFKEYFNNQINGITYCQCAK